MCFVRIIFPICWSAIYYPLIHVKSQAGSLYRLHVYSSLLSSGSYYYVLLARRFLPLTTIVVRVTCKFVTLNITSYVQCHYISNLDLQHASQRYYKVLEWHLLTRAAIVSSLSVHNTNDSFHLQDINNMHSWISSIRKTIITNEGLLDMYHPGTLRKNKWTCCSRVGRQGTKTAVTSVC